MLASKKIRKAFKIIAGIVFVLFFLLNFIIYNYTYKVVFPVTSSHLPSPTLTKWEKTKAFFLGVNIYKSRITMLPLRKYSTVQLKTKNGYIIEGWLIKADSGRSIHKTVILVPGIRNTKSTLVAPADFFNSLGYDCFLIDLRASGASTGDKCTFGMDEAEDVQLAYQYITDLYPGGEIVLWGESMGAVSILRSIQCYHLHPGKLILEKPFDHFRQAVKKSIEYFSDARLPSGMLSVLCTFWISWHIQHWAYNHNASFYAKSVSCPVLFQIGTMDKITDENQVRNIYLNTPVSKKRIEVYALSGHRTALCLSEPGHWEEVVADFLK